MTDFQEAERNFEIGSQLNQEKKFAEALVYFKRAATVVRPPALLVNYATALKEMGNFEEAQRLLLEADDKIPPDDTETKSVIAYNMANNLRESGCQRESVSWFLKAIEFRHGHRGQHFNLGQAYLQLDQFDKAIEQYDFILNQIDSNDAGAKRMREMTLMAKEEGLSLIDKEELQVNLPVYKWRNSKAGNLYNECLAMSLRQSGGGLGEKEIGQLYDRLRDNVDQIIQLESENESSDFWALACNTYATLSVLQEDREMAEKSVEMGNRSLQLQDGGRRLASSDLCILYEGLTVALTKLERLDEAAGYCMKGLKIQPQHSVLLNHKRLIEKYGSPNIMSGHDSSAKKKGCFIATAVCGSSDAPEVIALRQFRDLVLYQSSLGSLLVRIYYNVSPRLARYIRSDSIEAKLLYWISIRPLAAIASSWTAVKIWRIRNGKD